MPDEKTMKLLAGLAHEMNTPLGAIKSNNDVVELALQKIEAGNDQTREALAIIQSSIRTNRLACDRLISIVHNVRQFARVEDSELKRINIHQSLENTLALLAHELKHRIRVVKEFGALRDIDVFPGQINQLLLNILQNAAQSIDGTGEIRIKTWEDGDSLRIAISDNGRGIPADILPRIFDSGFTTRGPGNGEGLGLAICSNIIRNHNGRIDVESQPGHGATFTIVLERKANE